MYVDGSEYDGGGIKSPDSFTLTSSKYYSNTITIFELVFWRATLRKSYRYDYTF
mgnify:CR=1 FL=1